MKNIVLAILVPQFITIGRSVAMWLRAKDENDTGVDDEAGNAIDYALGLVEKYVKTPASFL